MEEGVLDGLDVGGDLRFRLEEVGIALEFIAQLTTVRL
jgi:hypothetical protein